MPRTEREARAWLEQQPSLTELQEAYPQEWSVVQRELAEIVPRGNLEELKAYVRQIAAPPATAGRKPVRGLDAALGAEIRRQMAAAAIKQLSLSAATGVHEGRVRFNLVNGWLAQKLLFESGLRRKPVSMPAFRMLWPLLWQRRFLMPLVGPQGIYCFYSKPLVKRLVEMIDGRPALEIAAGDGTLSRFLADAGADITATDDHSWRDVKLPRRRRAPGRARGCADAAARGGDLLVASGRQRLRARGLRDRQRRAVRGGGEQAPVRDRQLGGVRRADGVRVRRGPGLSKLVLPPELDAAVYVFRRRAT